MKNRAYKSADDAYADATRAYAEAAAKAAAKAAYAEAAARARSMTTMQMFLLADRLCEDCDGQGMVEHPAWRRYLAAYPLGLLPRAAQDDWWNEQGYGRDEIPPREVTCADCNGTGRIQERLTIVELADLLRPYWEVQP